MESKGRELRNVRFTGGKEENQCDRNPSVDCPYQECAIQPIHNPALRRVTDLSRKVEESQTNRRSNIAVCVITLDNVGDICFEEGVAVAHAAIEEFNRRLGLLHVPGDCKLHLSDTRVYLFLPGLVDQNRLLLVGTQIETLFSSPFTFERGWVNLDVHAGLVFSSEHNRAFSSDRLYSYAEELRQAAVYTRQPYVLESVEQFVARSPTVTLDQSIREAIQNHDILVYYQPKYRLHDHRLVGAEALVRWQRGSEIIFPRDFLPHISDSTLSRITDYCIRCVIKDSLECQSEVLISVNIDSSCLSERLLEFIVGESKTWEFDMANLMLEITESSATHHHRATSKLLEVMRTMGIKISIDDFGKGYSSMQRFRDLPADEIKLDRSFIRNIVTDSSNQQITQALIDLCHRFSKSIVAEGIENQETLDYLISIGCDVGQGFYLGAPMEKQLFFDLIYTANCASDQIGTTSNRALGVQAS